MVDYRSFLDWIVMCYTTMSRQEAVCVQQLRTQSRVKCKQLSVKDKGRSDGGGEFEREGE